MKEAINKREFVFGIAVDDYNFRPIAHFAG
jgi:hypothetical protein